MQITRKHSSTSNIIRCKLRSSTTGQGLTGLAFGSTGGIISTICDNEAVATTYTVAGSTIETITTLATYAAPTATKCRFKEVDATNHKGTYELQFADARFAVSGAKVLRIDITGFAGMIDKEVVIQLDPVPSDVTHWRTTAVSDPTVEGVPDVNTKTWNDLPAVALPLVPTTAGRTLDVSTGGEAGIDLANVGSPTTALNLSGVTIKNATDVKTIVDLIYTVVQLTDSSVSTMPTDTRNAILNRVLTGNHVTAGTVGLLLQFLDALISSRLAPTVSSRTLNVSAAGLGAAELDSATQQTLTDLGDMIEGGPKFTEDALSNTPTGGGGAGDASQETLLLVKAKTDLIGTAAGATTLLAAAILTPGTVVGFPTTLTIGDSYTTLNGRSISVPIVDEDGEPISASGSLNFADATITFILSRAKETTATRIINGTGTWVPGADPYVAIQLSSSETLKGLLGYEYAGVLKFTWSASGNVVSYETEPVQFDN